MSVNKQTDFGKINITNKAIASIVYDAAMESCGVVGICEKDNDQVLNFSDLEKGVIIKNAKNSIEISLFIKVASEIKVTEVLRSVQKKVKYVIEKTLECHVDKVSVYVQGIQKVS